MRLMLEEDLDSAKTAETSKTEEPGAGKLHAGICAGAGG